MTSTFGTLGSDSARYIFKNKVPLVDLGLRLADAEAMKLDSEPPDKKPKNWLTTTTTLKRHGATPEEIEFLKEARIELNALTSRQFVNFLERKFTELGISKVIPDDQVLESHARRVIKQNVAQKAIARIAQQIVEEAAQISLPDDLRSRLED